MLLQQSDSIGPKEGVGHGALLRGYTPACPDRADTRGVAEVAVASSVFAHMARGDTASMLMCDSALLVLVALGSRSVSSFCFVCTHKTVRGGRTAWRLLTAIDGEA